MTNFAPISAAPAEALLDEMMARVGVDGLAAALGDTLTLDLTTTLVLARD